jgi:tetratricopeptide (TPR) repeat protein
VGPSIPNDVTGQELDKAIRGDLRGLSLEAAEIVSRHLVMTARLLEDRPDLAWEHAKAAVARGGRLAVVREAAGVAAYTAGEYADALAQFRAARRISGSDSYWPIMADCERGLGRPERAISMAGADEVDRLDRAGRVEMRIVASGARRDLGQLDAAVVTLQCPELSSTSTEAWSARLKFAYADALLAAGREDEAREWFVKTSDVDESDETDAAERLADIDGIVWVDTLDGVEDDEDDEDDEEDDDLIEDLGEDLDDEDLDDDDDDEDDLDDAQLTDGGLGGELASADPEVDEVDEDDIDEDNLGEFAPPALDDQADAEDSDSDSDSDEDEDEPSIEDLALAGDDPTGGYGVATAPPAQDVPDSSSD